MLNNLINANGDVGELYTDLLCVLNVFAGFAFLFAQTVSCQVRQDGVFLISFYLLILNWWASSSKGFVECGISMREMQNILLIYW